MAEIFKNGTLRRTDCLVSFLIVGPVESCKKISESLYQNARERRWDVTVHRCESIADVAKAKIDISVDFIIFVFDLRAAYTLSEVQNNLAKVEEYYVLSGATCLVNCTGVSSSMGLIHKSKSLCHKYKIHFLSANVSNANACVNLAERIFCIAEAVLGLNNGIPIIGTVTTVDTVI